MANRRLKGWDYSRPYFYMVTIARDPSCALEFSRIREVPPTDAALVSTLSRDPRDYLEVTRLTALMRDVIMNYHRRWRCLEPITTFVVMPDHVHLLIKLRECDDSVTLPVIVRVLCRDLDAAATSAGVLAAGQHLFAMDWHDHVVKKRGKRVSQLAGFTRYIRENPFRAWFRRHHREYFREVHPVQFLGRTWYAYGNPEILDLPVLVPFKGHRSTVAGSPEWEEMLGEAERIGPGAAGVSTFMSELEKAVGNTIVKAGGRLVLLHPEGFPARWHPTRNHEALCAAGRMLYLSLYPPGEAKCDKATLYKRCHEMVDLAVEGLGGTLSAAPATSAGYAHAGGHRSPTASDYYEILRR